PTSSTKPSAQPALTPAASPAPSTTFALVLLMMPAPSPPLFSTTPAPAPNPITMPGAVAQDDIDITGATVQNSPPDIASWAVTSKISSIDVNAMGFQIEFDKRDGASSWPDYTPPGWGGAIEYMLWIVIGVNGQWYTSG